MAHQHRHAGDPDQERRREAKGEALSSQDEDLGQGGERRNQRHHHCRYSRRHPLLGPEEKPVVHHEDQHGEERDGRPLPPVRRGLVLGNSPEIEDQSRAEDRESGQKKRRNLSDADPDREEGGAQDEEDDGKGEESGGGGSVWRSAGPRATTAATESTE